jgi:hypothetical protein
VRERSFFQQISSRSRMRGPQVARKVVGIGSGRIERIARTLAPELAGGHVVSVATSSVDDVGEWRAAARKVARTLGEPIRTGITADGSRVWATLLRPVTVEDPRRGAGPRRAVRRREHEGAHRRRPTQTGTLRADLTTVRERSDQSKQVRQRARPVA